MPKTPPVSITICSGVHSTKRRCTAGGIRRGRRGEGECSGSAPTTVAGEAVADVASSEMKSIVAGGAVVC